jgi:hypothetical protein
VFVKDDYAYIGNGAVMTILDISDPVSPKEVGEIVTPDVIEDIYIQQHYAYIADGWAGLRIIDVRDPSNPVETGSYNSYYINKVVVSGSRAFACVGQRVAIIDVSIPSAPKLEENINTNDYVYDIAILKTLRVYLCIANSNAGLRIFDVTQKYNTDEVGSVITESMVNCVYVSGNYAYVLDRSSLYTIDLNRSENPQMSGTCYIGHNDFYNSIFIQGEYAYITADLSNTIIIVDISEPSLPILVTKYPSGGPRGPADIHVDDDKIAYVAHAFSGFKILDFSVPDQPMELAVCETGNCVVDIFVSGIYAYVSAGLGLDVFNVSITEHPEHLATLYTDSDSIFTNNIFVSNSYAYLTCNCGIWIVDVSIPEKPESVGFFYTYTEHLLLEMDVCGDYAYFGYDDRLILLDVSDKGNPREAAAVVTEGDFTDICISNEYAYAAYSDGLRIFDITTPEQIKEIGFYAEEGTVYIHVRSGYAYVTNLLDGLRIIDISNPYQPAHIGSYSSGYFSLYLEVSVSGKYAYIMKGSNGLDVVDISIPTRPVITGSYDINRLVQGLSVSGNLAYVGTGDAGFFILRNELADEEDFVPQKHSLKQNYPNPFNTSTSIRFELSVPERVTLMLFDINGREIETLVDNVLYNVGSHEIEWSAGRLPSGLYVYRLSSGEHTEQRKMILLK